MNKLQEIEKLTLKLKLFKYIEKYMDEVTTVDNNLGWLPENIESLMTDAAFSVLETVNSLNIYLQEEDLLK